MNWQWPHRQDLLESRNSPVRGLARTAVRASSSVYRDTAVHRVGEVGLAETRTGLIGTSK